MEKNVDKTNISSENFRIRESQFIIIRDRINADISNIKSLWTPIVGSMFSLIIAGIVAYYSGKIPLELEISVFSSLFMLVGFLIILIIYFYFIQEELNHLLTLITVIWFNTDLNLSNILFFYIQFRAGLQIYKPLIIIEDTGRNIWKFINYRIIRYRFWVTIFIGLFLPSVFFFNNILVNGYVSITTLFFLITLYFLSIVFIYLFSKAKAEVTDLLFRYWFSSQFSNITEYWFNDIQKKLESS